VARMQFELTSSAPPKAVLAALTDFSDRRPDIWPGLSRRQYQVYAVGDTWADAREGSGRGIWSRERYDWSTPGLVTWTVEESSFATVGDEISARVEAGPSGGSRIHVTWDRHGRGRLGRLVIPLLSLTRGSLVKRSLRAGLKRIEAAGRTGAKH
jgi:Polyketide cyclase / dehydrase and lipid transport